MRCSNCGNEQVNGQYCWRCGTKLVEAKKTIHESIHPEEAVSEITVVKVDSTVHLDSLKQQTGEYWNYFLSHLKRPSTCFTSLENEFKNGFISLLLYAAIFGFAFYKGINGMLFESFAGIARLVGEDYSGLSFSTVFFNAAGFIAVCMAVIVTGLFVIGMYFGPNHSVKQTVAFYSAHALPAILIGLVALLFLTMKSYFYGGFLLVASLIYVLMLSPGYVMSIVLSKNPKELDPSHGYAIYVVFVLILFGLLYRLTIN
ncbi:hypothetical protein MHZ92_20455 [Sporosarcina sp. ACRSL]|uniref:DUF6574 domain-containing protein n=1 Tax=Sporosarcina sp. ACRSL TaxID=2918215 RepID=UPI001EF55335|nr:DUF6574 domain-containing protein [Sporosarcina sp. ACRSL]MCG7346480.1 hypothetical protein [Sporosarcina sp. ACRSL]